MIGRWIDTQATREQLERLESMPFGVCLPSGPGCLLQVAFQQKGWRNLAFQIDRPLLPQRFDGIISRGGGAPRDMMLVLGDPRLFAGERYAQRLIRARVASRLTVMRAEEGSYPEPSFASLSA